ncbi:MAG TPA: acyl-protein synthetase [Polyangiaceae bacterium]|nr:acyl-protein synthetase [Polyangiaceae bacterium]
MSQSALIAESEALHERVRAFAKQARGEADFERLALEIAEYQARYQPGYARLLRRCGKTPDGVAALPAVPTDAFRLTRVAAHPPALDSACFVTSGTTGQDQGRHYFRTTRTYAELSVEFGRRALRSSPARCTAVALAPAPSEPPSSSLGFMCGLFMEQFDGRPLVEAGHGVTAAFDVTAAERWLLSPGHIDLEGLRRAVACAQRRAEPMLLLATSFALVETLDALDRAKVTTLPLPAGSVVMQTGGYKGRTREIPRAELRTWVARVFGIAEEQVASEYGMTELSSQLYEACVPGAELAGPRELHLAPPWLRVSAVDPVSLEPVAEGEVGLARFVDLANVDSALVILTRDAIRKRGPFIELLGRAPGAPPRGCSLAIEALLA